MTNGFQVLIVDDEPAIRFGLEKGLGIQAEKIDVAADADEALDKFQRTHYQIVVSDVQLPNGQDGLSLVSQMLMRKPDTTAIVITANEAVDKAVEAMRRGAFDFITKPVDTNLIQQQVRRAFERQQLLAENRTLKDRLADAGEISGVIGSSTAMQIVTSQIRQVAHTNASVLIHGENGTGKELVARVLHDLSTRRTGPFVTVNFGALPEALLESELLGQVPNSGNGSSRQKSGCLEQANGGTLFLDAIGELSVKGQHALLGVLATGKYKRIGSDVQHEWDARIVSATKHDLDVLVEQEMFCADLYDRLNVIPIRIPPLRERRSDIPLLLEHFLTHFCVRYKRPRKRFSDEATRVLMAFNWPGNVRQLRNVTERLVVTVNEDIITDGDLPRDISNESRPISSALPSLAAATQLAEREAIQMALVARNFHREQTAKALGISLRTLHYKMNRYGIH